MNFNIDNYIDNFKRNNNNIECKDKLGKVINIGDEVYITDISNLHNNSIIGTVTKCFVGLNNLPYIRLNRSCSSYEYKKYKFHNEKKCEDEKLSILCLKVPDDSFEDISLYD